MAKIKLPKNPLKLTPREKIELEVIHITVKKDALVVNTITLAFSILTKFDIKFLENAWGFHRGVT